MRVALYARYSSDLQNERSAEDQLAALRIVAAARGWTEAAVFVDRGISGASMATRPGVQTLLLEGDQRRFDAVLAEALDRLSRDQEDTAHIFKRLRFAGVELHTLSEGQVSVMHVGLAGTMNQLFLEELGKKTRRGLEARVRAGFSGGGLCYGYRVAGKGELEVDAAEAEVVRRIYRDYAAGASARAIALKLNAEGVAGPRGRTWSQTTLAGDRRAGDGVLCNPLYAGERVFNRRRFRKHPATGRRSSVLNPAAEWLRVPAPGLRIVEEALWQAVQARAGQVAAAPAHRARRPKRLLSGLMFCLLCGGPMTLQGQRYACANHRERGTCPNGKLIAAATVERRVLQGVERRLLSPDNMAHAVRSWHAQAEAERKAAIADRGPMERELAEIGRRLARAQEAYLSGEVELKAWGEMKRPLEARRAELEAALSAVAAPAAYRMHPGAAEAYRGMVAALHDALEGDDGAELREVFRSLIERVDFEPRPGKGDFNLAVHGKLARLLGISEAAARHTNAPGGVPGGACEVVVGAGARSGRNLTTRTVVIAA